MRFLVHGSIAYDLLLQYEGSFLEGIDAKNLENLSTAFVVPRMERHHGGTAANIAWNFALLNQEAVVVGTVGKDGGPYRALLSERGIDVTNVEQIETHFTATAIVATDLDERQITFFHPGADSQGKMPALEGEQATLDYAIVSPRDAVLMLKAAERCAKLGLAYLFDPGQQALRFGVEDLSRAVRASAGLIANEYEWGLIAEHLQWSIDDVLGACGVLVITKAEKGLTIRTREETIDIAACRADRVVNPVGAGDALRAGLLTGLASRWSLTDAARLGAAIASFVVEQEGTLLDTLDMDDLRERARETYGQELPVLPPLHS